MLMLLARLSQPFGSMWHAEAARRLGAKSANAYARYERGETCPTLEKLSEPMAAVSPGCDFVLQRGTAP